MNLAAQNIYQETRLNLSNKSFVEGSGCSYRRQGPIQNDENISQDIDWKWLWLNEVDKITLFLTFAFAHI